MRLEVNICCNSTQIEIEIWGGDEKGCGQKNSKTVVSTPKCECHLIYNKLDFAFFCGTWLIRSSSVTWFNFSCKIESNPFQLPSCSFHPHPVPYSPWRLSYFVRDHERQVPLALRSGCRSHMKHVQWQSRWDDSNQEFKQLRRCGTSTFFVRFGVQHRN